jgi:hypothetical protein
MCGPSFTNLILGLLDVWFALLVVNESRRECVNYKFLGEILNMY